MSRSPARGIAALLLAAAWSLSAAWLAAPVSAQGSGSAPIAGDDNLTTIEDTRATVDVLANDFDPDGDPLSVSGSSDGDHGTVSCTSRGDCTYRPDKDFHGRDTFVYTVGDGSDGTDTAHVSVTVRAVNDPPKAKHDQVRVREDQVARFNVLKNDSDDSDDRLRIKRYDKTESGKIRCKKRSGKCKYHPKQHFNGTDEFHYSIVDSTGAKDRARVEIRIKPVNDRPHAKKDKLKTTKGLSSSVSVLTNDSDPDLDTLEFGKVEQPEHGKVTCTTAGYCTYTPNENFTGTDSFTYRVRDGNGKSDSGKVVARVHAETSSSPTTPTTPTSPSTPDAGGFGSGPTFGDSPTGGPSDGSGGGNSSPVGVDDALSMDEGSRTIDVTANDFDPDGDLLSVASNTDGSAGTVSCSGGSCTYSPGPDFNGEDSFTYTVEDGDGGSATATVTVTGEPLVLTLDRVSVEPGGTGVASGEGCDPSAPAQLTVDGAMVGEGTAESDGTFSVPIQLPGDQGVGRYEVIASCGPAMASPIDVVLQSSERDAVTPALAVGALCLAIFLLAGGGDLVRRLTRRSP